MSVNGNTNNDFRLYEGFGQLDLAALSCRVGLYGQYVVNNATNSDEDTAWLAGVKTKVFGLVWTTTTAIRSVTLWSAPSPTPTSPTAPPVRAVTSSSVAYDIDKNFAVGATYFLTKADFATSALPA